MADDGDGMRLATSQGERRGRDVLIATGAWSPLLAKTTGLSKLPIQPGKGYSITYDRPALAPKRPLVLYERSVCVTAWDSGYRLGSTMEFSGYDSTLNRRRLDARSEEHTSELQSLMRISYAVFCLQKKKK